MSDEVHYIMADYVFNEDGKVVAQYGSWHAVKEHGMWASHPGFYKRRGMVEPPDFNGRHFAEYKFNPITGRGWVWLTPFGWFCIGSLPSYYPGLDPGDMIGGLRRWGFRRQLAGLSATEWLNYRLTTP